MPTRQKRPSIIKQLGITIMLGGFLFYMGYSAISGKYGTESREIMFEQIEQLELQSASLEVEIENHKQNIALLDPEKLDPDILSELARSLLAMSNEDDRIIILSPSRE